MISVSSRVDLYSVLVLCSDPKSSPIVESSLYSLVPAANRKSRSYRMSVLMEKVVEFSLLKGSTASIFLCSLSSNVPMDYDIPLERDILNLVGLSIFYVPWEMKKGLFSFDLGPITKV